MDSRALTLDDIPELTDLINRHEKFWEQPLKSTESTVEDELTEPFVDLDLDSRGYWLDEEMIGYALVWHRPSGGREERAYLHGLVDPRFRGRGIGRQILGWEMDRARQVLAAGEPSIPWYVRAENWDWLEDSHHLYRRFGMEPVRYFKDMIRPLDQEVEVRPTDGVEVIPWDRSLDELALEALNLSFQDHWGSTPVDAESFQHRLDATWSRIDLSFLAQTGEEVVGVCYNAVFPEDETVTGRREGWVMNLGVEQEWRGRGVATALLQTSFNAFLAAGLTHAMLGVDIENPTGALRLYEGLGFEESHCGITSQIQVNPAFH